MGRKIRLSVLDQSQIRRGSNAREAILESVDVGKLADRLGYTRYWVSDHHNFTLLAGSTPEVLIAHLAGETEHIRLGSGGIMLPNHSALKVAENFRMLETIFPGRIDLGIGRAPGGDRYTAHVLNPSNEFDERAFIQQIKDLRGFLTDSNEPGTVHEKIKAIPQAPTVPELWMLSSSGGGSQLAAYFGTALSFAQFINPFGGPEAVERYRTNFRPSEALAEPYAQVGIFAFCSEDEQKVRRWQIEMDARILNIEKGLTTPPPSCEEILQTEYTAAEQDRILYNRDRMICGTPEQMKQKLQDLAERYNVDEIMIATISDQHNDRLRSFELVAGIEW